MNVVKSKDYITPLEAQKRYGYSASTFRNWANLGEIKCERAPGGKRFYDVSSIERKIGIKEKDKNKDKEGIILYARVSSTKQREELKNQIETLQREYPEGEVISEIGSGLDYNRKGIKRLIHRISQGDIQKVAITYPDRLCRYGTELFEWIFEEKEIELVVLCGKDEEDEYREEELGKEILEICNFFTEKYNRRKRVKYRKQEQSEKSDEDHQILSKIE